MSSTDVEVNQNIDGKDKSANGVIPFVRCQI